MNNEEEEILRECDKLFVTMANVHINGKPMADLLNLYKKVKQKNKSLEQENDFLKLVYQGTDEFKAIEKLAGGK